MDQPQNPPGHHVQLRVLGKIWDVAPTGELLRRIVGERGEAVVATRNNFVLEVESSGVPVPDELM
jgi:hypothetical protein